MQAPWKVIAAFIGVFIAGSIFGGALALRVDREKQQPPPRHGGPPAQQEVPITLRLMRRFADRLALTDEQREQLRPVMERAGEDFRRITRASFSETNLVFERLLADVSKVLTPEQRDEFEKLRQEQRERLKQDRDRGGERRGEGARDGAPRPSSIPKS